MSEAQGLREALPRLAAFAAQALHWPPEAFWTATPDDLLLAFGSTDVPAHGLTRADLDRMMKDQSDG